MFGYMTEMSSVEIDEQCSRTLHMEGMHSGVLIPPPCHFRRCTGHDMMSLLFNFLDELLFAFCGDDFVCKDIKILSFDSDEFKITVSCKGERFSLRKHPQVSQACSLGVAVRTLTLQPL